MTWERPRFGVSLATALNALASGAALLSDALEDPLRLDLPPIIGGAGSPIDRRALETLAALYFAAELEQSGLVTVAELLVAERSSLDVRTIESAQLLEDFARSDDRWYDRNQRERLYARVFGLGRPATNDAGTTVNRDFEALLAALCSALVRAEEENGRGIGISIGTRTSLERSAVSLTSNLSSRQHGNTLVAATSIGDQLRAAAELLNENGMKALVGGRSLWDVVRFVLGEHTPDIGRLVARGQSGQEVLRWVATQGGGAFVVSADAAVAAARWLSASGFEIPSSYPFAA